MKKYEVIIEAYFMIFPNEQYQGNKPESKVWTVHRAQPEPALCEDNKVLVAYCTTSIEVLANNKETLKKIALNTIPDFYFHGYNAEILDLSIKNENDISIQDNQLEISKLLESLDI